MIARSLIAVMTIGLPMQQSSVTTDAPPPVSYTVQANGGGDVLPLGDAPFLGSLADAQNPGVTVDVATTSSGEGYWIVTSAGSVTPFGDAEDYGNLTDLTLNDPIVGMTVSSTGGGYILVASDGGVFAFGDAEFYGSTGGLELNQPIVGIAITPSGAGYWLVASDGGIFAYGDAGFYGSAGGLTLNAPIATMLPSPTGNGYLLFGTDGGVFAYGDASFSGSSGSDDLTSPVIDAAQTPSGDGYWLITAEGTVYPWGNATDFGSVTATPDEPIVAIEARPQGDGYWLVSAPTGLAAIGPSVPADSGSGRRIVYSNSGQRVWLVEENGQVFDSYLVSGRINTPAPGTYAVFSKSPLAWAGHDGITMKHMVRFAHGRSLAIGFHSIPTYSNGAPMQTVDQLGTYRSSGCVRQRVDKAKQLYDWSPIGLTVVVLA